MRNFVQPGDYVPLVAPAGGVVSGVGYVIGANTYCVAMESAAAGAAFTGVTEGVFDLPKQAAATAAQGARVWWDDTNKRVAFATATGLFLIGTLTVAATNGPTTARVRLDGISVVAAP